MPAGSLSSLYEYSYSFYYKFTFFPDTTEMAKLRSYAMTMSGFTENGSYDGYGPGDMNLVMIFNRMGNSAGFIGASYDLNCNDGCLGVKTYDGLEL